MIPTQDNILFSKEINMDSLVDNFVMTLVAPRRSGKSWFIKSMLKQPEFLERFDHIVIMCPSLKYNDDYAEFMDRDDELFTFIGDPTKAILEDLFNQQCDAKERVRAQERMLNKKKSGPSALPEDDLLECPKTLVILDDMIDSGLMNFHGACDKFAERGRHIDFCLILTSQRNSAVSRSVRINSDLFVIFCPYSISEIEQFLEQFVSRGQKKVIRKALDEIFNEKYQFVLLDNAQTTGKKLQTSNADDFCKSKVRILSEIYDLTEVDPPTRRQRI
jgi:hypothetical protein